MVGGGWWAAVAGRCVRWRCACNVEWGAVILRNPNILTTKKQNQSNLHVEQQEWSGQCTDRATNQSIDHHHYVEALRIFKRKATRRPYYGRFRLNGRSPFTHNTSKSHGSTPHSSDRSRFNGHMRGDAQRACDMRGGHAPFGLDVVWHGSACEHIF